MSWSVSTSVPSRHAWWERREELRAAALAQNPEAGDQFEAAWQAAEAIIIGGSVGNTLERKFHIVLSGHSNPDHAPRAGWANDCVNVSVSQV